MRVLYFARIRQIVGRGEDVIEVPPQVATVGDLIEFLKARDEGCAAAFADLRTVRAAINQTHVALDAALNEAREVAFFPPVTGG